MFGVQEFSLEENIKSDDISYSTEISRLEFESLGYYLQYHPVEENFWEIEQISPIRIKNLSFNKSHQRSCGVIISHNRIQTRRGAIVFATLDDNSDRIELIINQEVLDDSNISFNGGKSWSTQRNQPTAQFYRVTTDNQFPYRIYGAQQDNTTVRINHRGSGSGIGESDWETTAGGESAHLAPDPKNNDIVYGGTYKGYMMRKDHRTDQTRSVNIWPDNPAGSGAEVMKYRFNWNFPVKFSIHDENKLFAGSNFLHMTTDGGQSWKTISPDLTRGLPETIKSSGGPITQDNTGAEFYSNLFAINESPIEKGVIWVGSDDGLIHVTTDNGETWKNVTPPPTLSPKLNMINCIDPSPFKKGTAYVAATSYKFGDYKPYLYKTNDYGKTWSLITKGIPENYYSRAIRSCLLYTSPSPRDQRGWGMAW